MTVRPSDHQDTYNRCGHYRAPVRLSTHARNLDALILRGFGLGTETAIVVVSSQETDNENSHARQ
jgi:hypothetical protein